MPLFDAYIFVDWSARNSPHPLLETENAVWVGKLIPGDNLQEENYHRTRFDGFAYITSCLLDQVKKRRRILVESRLTRNGIQETWQLFGRGSVGSQALVGIPYVYKLRRHVGLDTISRVWPFETQFTTTPSCNRGPFILHAEIWPGLVNQRTQELTANGWIRDRAQVRIMCQWAAECDNEGTLGQFFERPNGLDQQQVQSCIEEEGWILGASE